MKAEELAVIKERAVKATKGPWEWNVNCYARYELTDANSDSVLNAEHEGEILIYDRDADFIAHAREDVPKLVAEVERLRKAIDSAISLLPDGENRLANRHLCEAIEVDEDYYGFFSGGDE